MFAGYLRTRPATARLHRVVTLPLTRGGRPEGGGLFRSPARVPRATAASDGGDRARDRHRLRAMALVPHARTSGARLAYEGGVLSRRGGGWRVADSVQRTRGFLPRTTRVPGGRVLDSALKRR